MHRAANFSATAKQAGPALTPRMARGIPDPHLVAGQRPAAGNRLERACGQGRADRGWLGRRSHRDRLPGLGQGGAVDSTGRPATRR